MDYFGNELKAFKANLHTHSTTSDGKFEPEKVIQLYAEADMMFWNASARFEFGS